MNQVEVIEKKRVFDGFFKIDSISLRLELSPGSYSPVMRRLCFERGDSAAAVVWRKDAGDVLLVRQFRAPAYEKGPGFILELPAGAVEPGEAPSTTIIREIEEEMGYRVAAAEQISVFYPSPGGCSERIFLFYAETDASEKISAGGGAPSEHEYTETLAFKPDALRKMLAEGEIADAKTIIGLLWLQNKLTLRP